MATLTTSYQKLGETYLGSSSGNLYIRIYAKYSEQDIANNRSKVQYQARAYFSGNWILDQQSYGNVQGTSASQVNYSKSTNYTNGETELGTTEAWVYHNDNGEKSISCSAYLKFPNWGWSGTASGTADLPTIPRASSISCNGGNIGSSTTISISRAVDSFTHTISYSFGSLNDTIATKTSSTSISWTIPTSFYAQIPSSNSGTITLTCQTYNGNTLIGTKTTTCTAKVVNSNPTFNDSQLTYFDSNNSIVAITESNQIIVRNQSNLKVSYTAAIGVNSATISSYIITFNGNTQTKTSATTIDYGAVNLSSNTTVSVKAIDSRGNSTTISKTIQIKDWVLPSATITAGRVNNYEDETHLKANVTISSVGEKNAIQSIKYRYKKSGTSDYSSYVNMSNNVQSTVSIDKLYAWDFQLVVTDKFGSTTYNFKIAKGMPIMFIDNNKLAVGVNVFPRGDRAFDVDGHLFASTMSSNTITGYSIKANGSLHSKIALSIEDSNDNEKAKLNKNGLYFDTVKVLDKNGLYFNNRNILDGFKYSTSEVKTNKTWINNKPIYRKVITTTNTVANDTTISHNISNVDMIYIANVFFVDTNSNTTWSVPTNLYGLTDTVIDKVNTYVTNTVVGFKCDTTWPSYWTKYIVLEYTKTTD